MEELTKSRTLANKSDQAYFKKLEQEKIQDESSDELSIPIIASGGAGKLNHFKDGVTIGKANALLAASVFHFGEVSIQNVKDYLRKEGINVRIDQ